MAIKKRKFNLLTAVLAKSIGAQTFCLRVGDLPLAVATALVLVLKTIDELADVDVRAPIR